jgi:DNA-binding transcriptional MerR regulator
MRIGQLAERADVNPKTIRYYEEIGLLPPPKRAGNRYRMYDDGDLTRLVFVRTAQRLGLSLDDIREILAFRERGERPCGYVLDAVKRESRALDERIRELKALRDELRQLVADAEELGQGDAEYCSLIEAHRNTR